MKIQFEIMVLSARELNKINGGSYQQLLNILEAIHIKNQPFLDPTGAVMPLPYSQIDPAYC